MQHSDQFLSAIENYLAGKATAAEKNMVDEWYSSFKDESVLAETGDINYERQADMRLRLKIEKSTGVKIGERSVTHVSLWSRIAVAAAAVAAIVFGAWFYTSVLSTSEKGHPMYTDHLHDIQPGTNKAVLTLPDGKVIQLSDTKDGIVIDASAIAYSDGTMVDAKSQDVSSDNTTKPDAMTIVLSTPRAGTYQVVLPDGSKVWLNAASSIRFPKSFAGLAERKVALEGEAYFEIEKDRDKPFRVASGNQITEVLGTHFNINSYPDERVIKTTLLEGSVKVLGLSGKKWAFLKPGQQSQFTGDGFKFVPNADVDQAVAWKNGFFQFSGAELSMIMRQLARWYNVDVDLSRMPQKEFDGVISRNVPLSKVLKMLELTSKLEFKLVQTEGKNGRRVIMLK